MWLDRKLATGIVNNMSQANQAGKKDGENSRISSLTKREREVFNLVSAGLKNKVIADRLFISEITVRHHLTAIFSKLEIASRFELVILAHRHKLVNPLH